jgi:hypothetical protein
LNAITYKRETKRRFLSMVSSNNMFSLAAEKCERQRREIVSKMGNF